MEDECMTLADLSNGPDWIMWGVFVVLLLLSVVLISGHGSGLIAGYNAASKEEKLKYDEKKLCKTVGMGLGIISLLLLVMGLFENVLPFYFAYVSLGIIIVDVVAMIIAANTVCRKR